MNRSHILPAEDKEQQIPKVAEVKAEQLEADFAAKQW